jgi:methyltransferase family protein
MIKAVFPWWLKIPLKIVLSGIPVPYRSWAGLGIFKLGSMTDPAYALEVFQKHYGRVDFAAKGKGFVCLELGPGDSLCTAPIARAYGARKTILVDTGRYASDDMGPVRALVNKLAESAPCDVSDIGGAKNWDDILRLCGSQYLFQGVASLKDLPEASVDFAFSNAVLEHVRRHEFEEMAAQLRRVMRAGGVSSHTVDLTDHLDGGLNSLRFSERLWEGSFFSGSGFYTNRLRLSDIVNIMASAGFSVESLVKRTWASLPLPRRSMDRQFASMSDEDLVTCGFDIVLRAG